MYLRLPKRHKVHIPKRFRRGVAPPDFPPEPPADEKEPGVAILFLLLDPLPELTTETERGSCVRYIYVEYAEGRIQYSILFTFRPFARVPFVL